MLNGLALCGVYKAAGVEDGSLRISPPPGTAGGGAKEAYRDEGALSNVRPVRLYVLEGAVQDREYSSLPLTHSGASVLELCPAPESHTRGRPSIFAQARLYRFAAPARSFSPQRSRQGQSTR